MKAYNFNDKIYIQTNNDCFAITQSGDPETNEFTATFERVNTIPDSSFEIPYNDVIVLAAMDNLQSYLEVLFNEIATT